LINFLINATGYHQGHCCILTCFYTMRSSQHIAMLNSTELNDLPVTVTLDTYWDNKHVVYCC